MGGLLEPQPPPWSVFPTVFRGKDTSDASSSPHYPTPRAPLQGNSHTKGTSTPRGPLHEERPPAETGKLTPHPQSAHGPGIPNNTPQNDKIVATKAKQKGRFRRVAESTWEQVLEKEWDIPKDWLYSREVLVGRRSPPARAVS